MQDQNYERAKASHLDSEEQRQAPHYEPDLFQQITPLSTETNSDNPPKPDKQYPNPPERGKVKGGAQKREEQMQLGALMRDNGADWQHFGLNLNDRQEGDIKRHCFSEFKKIVERMVSYCRSRMGDAPNKSTFHDLKNLIAGSGPKQAQSELVLETRELLFRVLIYRHLESTLEADSCEEHRQLDRLLHDFKRLMKKTRTQAASDRALQSEQRSSEEGYSSDCSSIFQEQPFRKHSAEIQKCAVETVLGLKKPELQVKGELFELPELKLNEGTKGSIVVQDQKDIQALLLSEGLLDFEEAGERQLKSWEMGCESEELHSETQHCFYLEDEIEGESFWKRMFPEGIGGSGDKES